MSALILETLKEKRDTLKKRLDEINKMLEIDTTSKIFRAKKGVMDCIKFHQKTDKPYFLQRAEIWEKAFNKYMEIDKKITANGHFIDEKVSLQEAIRELNKEIYYSDIKRREQKA